MLHQEAGVPESYLQIPSSNPSSASPAPQTDVDFSNHLGDLQSGFLRQESKQARHPRTALPFTPTGS